MIDYCPCCGFNYTNEGLVVRDINQTPDGSYVEGYFCPKCDEMIDVEDHDMSYCTHPKFNEGHCVVCGQAPEPPSNYDVVHGEWIAADDEGGE